MWPNPQETSDLVTVTEEILNGKLHFLCSVISVSAKNTSSLLAITSLKLTFTSHSTVSIVKFEQVNSSKNHFN